MGKANDEELAKMGLGEVKWENDKGHEEPASRTNEGCQAGRVTKNA